MKDIIDKLNEQEKIKRSIIKHWNVNYIPVRDMAGGLMGAETAEAAGEAADEAGRAGVAQSQDGNGEISVSRYGSAADEISDVTKGQIEKILHEKTDAIREIVTSGGNR